MFESGNYKDYVSYQNFFSSYRKKAAAAAVALGAKECAG